MTFYDVDISNPQLAGHATDSTTLLAAIEAVEKHFVSGLVVNAAWCEECKDTPYEPGVGSPVYHVFMGRELPILEIVAAGTITWRKKRGMGRSTPLFFLTEAVKLEQEHWFQLELSEL